MKKQQERGDGPFDRIDSKLTIYALANGMDLVKEPARRRLSWYSDGRERGLVIEVPEEDVYRLRVGIWKTGGSQALVEEELTRVASTQLLLDSLGDLMEQAQERANQL